MIRSCFKSFTFALACSASLILARPAYSFDPVTMSMGISVAQGILSLGSKGSNVELSATMASLEMLRAVHERLDGIENGIEMIISLVVDLPEEMRRALNDDRDIVRSETVKGRIANLEDLIGSLKSAIERGDKKAAEKWKTDIRNQWLDFRNERGALFSRTDFVFPILASAMLIEVMAVKAIGEDDEEITKIVSAYDARFAQSQIADGNNKGTLASLRKSLEGTQTLEEEFIMKEISGTEGPLADGNYAWMAFMLTSTSREKVEVHCGGSKLQPVDGPPPSSDPCWEEKDVTRPVHHKVWTRTISRAPLEVTADLFTITLTISGGEALPGDRPDTPPTANDGESERPFRAAHQILQDRIKQFNLRAEGIRNIRDLESVASLSRSLAANWDSGLAKDLAERSVAVQDARENLNKIGQIDRQVKAYRAIAVMDQKRREAWVRVENADRELQKSLEQAKADGWRADLMMGLQVLQLSLQTYQLVDGILNKPAEKADTKKKATNNRESSPKIKAKTKVPSPSDNRLDAMGRVQQILSDGDKSPASAWERLPENLTPQETSLIEAVGLLDTMDAATVKDISAPSGDGERFLKGARMVRDRNFRGALLEVVLPSVAEAPELDSWETRNVLRRRVNDQLLEYQVQRIRQKQKK